MAPVALLTSGISRTAALASRASVTIRAGPTGVSVACTARPSPVATVESSHVHPQADEQPKIQSRLSPTAPAWEALATTTHEPSIAPAEDAPFVLDASLDACLPTVESASADSTPDCMSITTASKPSSSSVPTAPSSAQYAPSSASSTCGDWGLRDHNSVTVKADTSVKDAAGAIVKVLNRTCSTFVTALRLEASHESLNRALKALAVSRKYMTDQEPGKEVGFLPLHRSNEAGQEDPELFAFLAFKAELAPGVDLRNSGETDINVSGNSDPQALANAVVRILKDRGQAVMKAGGQSALRVATLAVIHARRRLKKSLGGDCMVVPQWITEDTTATLGRASKFLQLNLLPCAPNGVPGSATPGVPASIIPVPMPLSS